jgi:predicted dehydrogenase
VLHTAEVVRYSEATRGMRLAVQRGIIGQVQMWVSGSVGCPWSPNGIIADTPWRHRKVEAGGGPSIDLGVHAFSLIRHVCGEVDTLSAQARTFEPIRVRRDAAGEVVDTVQADVEDTFFATFTLARGGVGQLFGSWAGHGEGVSIPQALYGSRGCIRAGVLQTDAGEQTPIAQWYRREADPAERARHYPYELEDRFALENLDFLSAVAAGREPEYTGAEGLKDLATAFAVLESAYAGTPVRVADVESGAVRAYQQEIDTYWGL